jgi:hypothetical protein
MLDVRRLRVPVAREDALRGARKPPGLTSVPRYARQEDALKQNYLKSLLREEVEELTLLLRRADDWGDLRQALISQGLQPEEVLLAAFHEDGDHSEHGVFVANDRRVFEYERTTRQGAELRFRAWQERTGEEQFARDNPQIDEALALISNA